jgi:hypothetical protein
VWVRACVCVGGLCVGPCWAGQPAARSPQGLGADADEGGAGGPGTWWCDYFSCMEAIIFRDAFRQWYSAPPPPAPLPDPLAPEPLPLPSPAVCARITALLLLFLSFPGGRARQLMTRWIPRFSISVASSPPQLPPASLPASLPVPAAVPTPVPTPAVVAHKFSSSITIKK